MGLSRLGEIRYIRLGDYIERSTINNKDLKYDKNFITGVSNKGVFIEPKGNVDGVNLKPYKIVDTGAFVYNPSRLDIGSIAYRKDGVCIVSHLYQIFYLNDIGKKTIVPFYLFIYFHRKEFYREVSFRNFGSQRPEFNLNDMSEILIPLPPIEIQQKYVDIYNAMLLNQQAYEKGLDDLKLTCDAYVEKLKATSNEVIGTYIEKSNLKNEKNICKNIMGLSTLKQFRIQQKKTKDEDYSKFKIVKPRQIAYVQVTDTWKVLAFALNDTCNNIAVSPIYEVFTISEGGLLPEFLAVWMKREEFDRYARFHSWGSARETFSWEEMCNVKIPIPDIKIQQAIVDIYTVYQQRKEINDRLKKQIKDICPILIKGALEEGKRG